MRGFPLLLASWRSWERNSRSPVKTKPCYSEQASQGRGTEAPHQARPTRLDPPRAVGHPGTKRPRDFVVSHQSKTCGDESSGHIDEGAGLRAALGGAECELQATLPERPRPWREPAPQEVGARRTRLKVCSLTSLPMLQPRAKIGGRRG